MGITLCMKSSCDETLADTMIPNPMKHKAPRIIRRIVSTILPLIIIPNRSIAATIRIIPLPVSCTNLDIIFPPITVATLVGVINNLASSPLSLSPATISPIPNTHPNKMVIPIIAGTRKSK